MRDWKSIEFQSDLSNSAYFGQDYINRIVREMKLKLAEEFVDHMQLDTAYIVKLSSEYYYEPTRISQATRFVLSFEEVPQQNIQFVRQYKCVTVDALEIESINCRNCAAPIPVGRLDLQGDTLVRCSYCGTYHTIKKKG